MRITILAIGKQKNSPTLDMCNEYIKRMKWKVKLVEIESPKSANSNQEAKLIEKKLPSSAFIIALDERGKTLSSIEFSKNIEKWYEQSPNNELFFLIGGADGFNENIRKRANFLMSFGKQTWPHMLVRVMLLEQVYRAQQIASGHPYHRR